MKPFTLALLLAAATTMSGCSDKASKLRETFIDSCKSNGATTAICSCIYDHIERDYGKEKLVEMDENPNPAANIQLVNKTINYVPMCLKK